MSDKPTIVNGKEVRPITVVNASSAPGRTQELVICPFCQEETWTYVWSRYGSGKKCSCGALLCGWSALKKIPVLPKERP